MVASAKFQPQRSDEYREPNFRESTFTKPQLVERNNPSTKSQPATQRCWNCEETVHRSASECPYCRKSLAVFQETVQDEVEATLYKIPTLHSPTPHSTILHSPSNNTADVIPQEPSTPSPLILLSTLLLTTLSGALLLLSCLIVTFSDGISFTLEWSHASWIPIGGIGCILGGIASILLQKIRA